MTIEELAFERMTPLFHKFEAYGFQKLPSAYVYKTAFPTMDFRAELTITTDGRISGRVIDTDTEEEYIPIHAAGQSGSFVGAVKEEYLQLLADVAAHCFQKELFLFPQANRIASAITETFGDTPDFPFKTAEGYGVFRNPGNRKWYALIMNITEEKLTRKTVSSKVKTDKRKNTSDLAETPGSLLEIMNVKIASEKIPDLLTRDGIYPCYHMNHKNWISVALNDSLSDEAILELLRESHAFTESGNSTSRRSDQPRDWLIPANPKYFDIQAAFRQHEIIDWKQGSDIRVGDTVYMYVAAPVSAILYQCRVTEANIPYDHPDPVLRIKKLMKIQKLREYPEDQFTFAKLKEVGVNAIRGPRNVPKELLTLLTSSRD